MLSSFPPPPPTRASLKDCRADHVFFQLGHYHRPFQFPCMGRVGGQITVCSRKWVSADKIHVSFNVLVKTDEWWYVCYGHGIYHPPAHTAQLWHAQASLYWAHTATAKLRNKNKTKNKKGFYLLCRLIEANNRTNHAKAGQSPRRILR